MQDTGFGRMENGAQGKVFPIITDLNQHIQQVIYKKRLIAQQEAERREQAALQAPANARPAVTEGGPEDAFAVLDLTDPDNYFAKIQRMQFESPQNVQEPPVLPAEEGPDLTEEPEVAAGTSPGKNGREKAPEKESGQKDRTPGSGRAGRPMGQPSKTAGTAARSAAPPARDIRPRQKKDAAFRGERSEKAIEKERRLKRDKEMEVHELHRPASGEMLSKAVSPQTASRIDEKATEDLVRKAAARSAQVPGMTAAAAAVSALRGGPGAAGKEMAPKQETRADRNPGSGRTLSDAQRMRQIAPLTKENHVRNLNDTIFRAGQMREAYAMMHEAAVFTHSFSRPVMFRTGSDTLMFVKEGKENRSETYAVLNGKKVSDREATKFFSSLRMSLGTAGTQQLMERLLMAEKNPYQNMSKDLLPKAVAPAMDKERNITSGRN